MMTTVNSTPSSSSTLSLRDIHGDVSQASKYVAQLIELLELDADSYDAQKITLDLIKNGRQHLVHYRDDISEETYEVLMQNDRYQLLTLISEAIRYEWTIKEPTWLDVFLNEQKIRKPKVYKRILHLVAEHGCASMRGCVPLASVILFQYELVEENNFQRSGKFDEIWQSATERGRLACPDIPLQDGNSDPLFLALKEFYRDKVVERLRSVDIPEVKWPVVIDLAVDLVAMNGWDGLKDDSLKRKLSPRAFRDLNERPMNPPSCLPLVLSQTYETVLSQDTTTAPTMHQSANVECVFTPFAIYEPANIQNNTISSYTNVLSPQQQKVSSSNAVKPLCRYTEERNVIQSCININSLFQMVDFTQAGELLYTKDTLMTIASRLVTDFNKSHMFPELMKDCLIPMMYLLKRELNLLDFIKLIKQGLIKTRNIPRPSQRMLVDILLKNSESFLAQILVKLLSKRNVVPLFEVDGESQKFVPYIIRVWDYTKPTILSFGIGPCAGKSSLLNNLFLSNFEQTTSSSYFQQTIDVDFGYSFIPPRLINIADVHGEISLELLDKVRPLFDSFLIHVNATFLFNNLSLVKQFLAHLPSNAYRFLLIRDAALNEDSTVLHQLPISDKLFLPEVIDKTTDESQVFLKQLLEVIYCTSHFSTQRLSKDVLVNEFYKLLPHEHRMVCDQEIELIRSVEPTLIQGDKKHFPLYDIFVQMCKKRDELSRIDFYGSNDNEAMFNAQADLFELEVKLKPDDTKPKDCGEAFITFFNVLRNPSKFTALNILASGLKEEIGRRAQVSSMAVDLPYESRLSMEVHWRNAIVCYDHMRSNEQKQELVQHYHDIIVAGQPFEIIDGDNFYYQSGFLENVMANMHNARFFVISIIGPQNSGKSTLLNYMFGTLFDVRDGRCTRGVYGSMVKSNRPDFDYIMLIDTEGLLSIEKNDEEYDRRLILFCLAVSHLVIVNVAGEVSATLMKMLLLCTDSLQKLGVNKVHRPPVHIILNQKANPDPDMNKAAIRKIKEELEKVKLDQQIELNDETFHTLPSAFTKVRFETGQTASTLLRTDPEFIEKVQHLCEQFVSTAAKSLEQACEQFTDPLRWVKFAATVLDILRKFPDMTYFNDIREREQDDLIRKWIRKVIETEFTAELRENLLSDVIGQSVEETKRIFELKFQILREKLTVQLENQLKLIAATENVRQRSKNFFNVQIDTLLCARIESAIMSNERHRLEELVRKGETQFHELIQKTIEAVRKTERHELKKLVPNADVQFLNDIQSTVRSSGRLNEQQAGDIFDKIWNDAYPRVESKFDHDKQVRAALQFVYRNYHIFEKSNLPDVKSLLPLLTSIPRSVEITPAAPRVIADETAQQQIDMQILQQIQQICIQKMSDHSPIQELPFEYDKTAEYTRKTIDEFKYLYVPTLIKEYDKYHNHETANIWSRRFHLHLRRFILQKNSAQAPSHTQPGIWKKLLHIRKSFEQLHWIILSAVILNETSGRRRPVDIDLVQQLVGMVLGHINKINDELGIFKLGASMHYLGMMHTYTVLVLTKFYYDEQWRFFDDVLLKVRKNRPGWRAYFIVMVTQNQTADPKFAQDLVQVFVNSVIEYFRKKVQEKIKERVQEDEKSLDRLTILTELDTQVATMTDDELYNYITDPVQALKNRFNESWISTQAAIELFIEKCKQEYQLIIEQFFQVLETIQSVLQQYQADKPTFINGLFAAGDGSGDLNIANKGRCVSLLLYAYFSKQKPLPHQFQLFGVTYLLSEIGKKMIEKFPKFETPTPPKVDITTILSTMAEKFDSISVLNLVIFVHECLNQRSAVVQYFENNSRNAGKELEKLCLDEKAIFEKKQCERSCPCCHRICDVDHTIDKRTAAGVGENLHRCQIGHQYRAFAKVKYITKNAVNGLHEASMQRCESMQDRDELSIENVTNRIKWAAYKLKHKDWNWNFTHQEISSSSRKLSTNLPSVWRRIGRRWCAAHGMDYVIENQKPTRNSDFYNTVAGQSVITNALSYDKYGNPLETIYDLGRDGAFSNYSVLIGQFYLDSQFNDTAMQKPLDALKVKGFAVKHVKTESDFITELQSNRHEIAWVISTNSINNSKFLTALTTFHSAGGAIFLFADNEPYICHVSQFLQKKFGITLLGNYYGGKTLTYKENGGLQAGNFGKHEIFTGIQNLYEGITICHPVYSTPESRQTFVTVATATDSNPSIAIYNPHPTSSDGRLVLDCGFTKLYCNWDTAGTARYIVNVTCWLLGVE